MTVSVVLAMAVAIIFLRVAGSSSMRLPGLAVFLMIRQLADFMTLAGTEEHEGGGQREDHEVADNGTHRRRLLIRSYSAQESSATVPHPRRTCGGMESNHSRHERLISAPDKSQSPRSQSRSGATDQRGRPLPRGTGGLKSRPVSRPRLWEQFRRGRIWPGRSEV